MQIALNAKKNAKKMQKKPKNSKYAKIARKKNVENDT
jgi:hypothetical protein